MAIKCIGILTSGGDAPGMNAAIRAVTRTAIYNGYKVKGILRGYHGLVTNKIIDLTSSSVSNIIQKGGTILKTARSKEFRTPEGRQIAYDNMKAAGIDALVVIGGDGSLSGAQIFANEATGSRYKYFHSIPRNYSQVPRNRAQADTHLPGRRLFLFLIRFCIFQDSFCRRI